jgi:competence protein ComEA
VQQTPDHAVAPAVAAPGIPPAAAFDPGRRGVRGLALVAVLVLGGAAVLAWQARPRPEAVAPIVSASEQPDHGGTESAEAAVVVAVTGKVHRPGLVRLPAGARVADAIDAAGGALPGTDLSLVNLARKVSDGELIAIGIAVPPGAGPGGAPGGGNPAPGAPGGKVNLNTATQAELETLPGVGPVLAQRILDYRQRHGGFRSIGELRKVEGIGDARYEQLKDLVTV